VSEFPRWTWWGVNRDIKPLCVRHQRVYTHILPCVGSSFLTSAVAVPVRFFLSFPYQYASLFKQIESRIILYHVCLFKRKNGSKADRGGEGVLASVRKEGGVEYSFCFAFELRLICLFQSLLVLWDLSRVCVVVAICRYAP
jgi:hypothetical protein